MTATMATVPPSTRTLLAALIAHYRKPGTDRDGEVLITEAAAPGPGTRRADLVRVGMWASRGTGIDIHEIKVSRSDWLRELDDPAKADAWWPYCSRFWLVTPPGIVADGELPEGWGLMTPQRGRRFRVEVQAPTKAPELTVPLLVELLRRADNSRLAEIDELRSKHRMEIGKVRDEARHQTAVAELPYDVRQRMVLLERLEKALGRPLSLYGSGFPGDGGRITPEELAALIGDAGDHLAAQRLAADNARIRHFLTQQVQQFLAQLERAR